MPAQSIHTEGFVLTRRPAADPFQSCILFSGELGSLHVLQRLPKKPASTRVQLDLFDEVAVDLDSSNQGRTWFVREARLIARATDIGRTYESLKAASAFTAMIARNPVAPESRAPVADLLRTAIAAFSTSTRPDVVAFKCLYLFARDEGHPVKQQWLPMLGAADLETAVLLLKRPLAQQTTDPESVARLQRSLEEYLSGNTELQPT